jgi:hypothetical protein
MSRSVRPPVCSKASVKSQTVLPREMRATEGIIVDKAPADTGGPFAVFSEWSSEADEKAYRKL